MKPEKKVSVELSEDAKGVMESLKKAGKTDLNSFKESTGLSNKKWDKAIKELTKNGLAKVQKTDDSLTVEFVG